MITVRNGCFNRITNYTFFPKYIQCIFLSGTLEVLILHKKEEKQNETIFTLNTMNKIIGTFDIT